MTFWATPVGWTLITVGQILAVTVGVLISLAFLLLADRKIWAGVQLRKGPNVVGPFGLMQSFADFLKFVLKEIIVPAGADKFVFLLAPVLSFVLAFGAWAAIPLAPGWVISNINVGVLYLFAISSLGVYGIIMGGWASNSKYPFLGGLRSAAQMVSYVVAGYQVEYSSTPYLLFMIGEYANIVLMCALISILFFGGWSAPWPTPYLANLPATLVSFHGFLWFAVKVVFWFFMIAMVKAIVPRYRYDQLMRLGWKVFLPTSLVAVVAISAWRVFGPGA
jgi:NADH:ubiquinone oxidoreductase subunit H